MRGNCFCGSVSYELSSKPKQVYYCHCRDCQMLSGSAFHVLGVTQRRSIVKLAGELTTFSHPTASGSVMHREFCPKCGTPLFLKSSRFPDIQMFTVSALEQPDALQPSFEIWTSSKLPWSVIAEELKSFVHGADDSHS